MNKVQATSVLKYLYWGGLGFMLVSIPIFNVGMSIAIIWLVALSLIYLVVSSFFDLNLKKSLRNPFKNPFFLLPALFYLMHLIGLLYSDDIPYAIHDLRIKLPILLVPLALTYLPKIETKIFEKLLWIYVFAVLFSIMTSLMVYWGIVKIPYQDIREITNLFITRISHIRLSLNVDFALVIVYYFWREKRVKKPIILLFIAFPLLYFMWVIQSLTGAAILLVLIGYELLKEITIATNVTKRYGYLVIFFSLFFSLFYGGYRLVSDYYHVEDDLNKLPEVTALGNPYTHNTHNKLIENHHYVWINISQKELTQAWNQRSSYDAHGKDDKGQKLYMTLWRYMTSKGLTKDAAGINQLNDVDIHQIESGSTNAYSAEKTSLRRRLDAVIFEFDNYFNGGNPSGNSVVQRFEFWKAGWGVFKQNPLIGCGTGDINNKMLAQYTAMNSSLDKRHRLHCHNQYLSIGATFGVIGFFMFLVMVFYGFFKEDTRTNSLLIFFILISALSFLAEDTLETQAGVTFYIFFSVFLLLPQRMSKEGLLNQEK